MVRTTQGAYEVGHQGIGRGARALARYTQRGRANERYHGQDRRGVVVATGPPGPLFMVGASTLLILVLLVWAVGQDAWTGPDSGSLSILVAQLDAAAFALALLLATLCYVRWRLIGEAAVLWLGSAAFFYGLLTLSSGYVQSISVSAGNPGVLWLQPVGWLAVIALVVLALWAPHVDARLRPLKIVAGAGAAIAIVTVLLQLMPVLDGIFVGPSPGPPAGSPAPLTLILGFVAAWAVLGFWSTCLGLRQRRYIFSWFGLWFASLACAALVAVPDGLGATTETLGPAMIRGFGLLCAVLGATNELVRAYVAQSGKLLASVTSERSIEARMAATLENQAERAHEAQNALVAIEGATRTLQRYQDQLDVAARAELAEAVSNEIHRLQQLVSVDPVPPLAGRFRLTEALSAVVSFARWHGTAVTVDVPEHLVAVGQPADVAQVLQNLFQNASRYAGGAVVVRGSVAGERVLIQVEDDGPGIPVDERHRVFERGERGSTAGDAPGSGLGLFISARLMRQQQGELWVKDSPSGGACFVMSLPGFSELAAAEVLPQQPFDDADESRQLVLAGERSVLAFPRHRQLASRRIENEDGVRDDLAR
jgi:signal transduction histidine kinase